MKSLARAALLLVVVLVFALALFLCLHQGGAAGAGTLLRFVLYAALSALLFPPRPHVRAPAVVFALTAYVAVLWLEHPPRAFPLPLALPDLLGLVAGALLRPASTGAAGAARWGR